jgi:hypothetical protein
MKTHDLKAFDETDARVLRDRLQLHCANLRGLVHTAQGQLLTRPKLSAEGDVIADIRTLETHCSELEARLGSSCPQFAPGAGRVSGLPAARTVAGLSAGERVSASPKLSLTERVLRAQGVGSLSALREKLVDTTPEERSKKARQLKGVAH